MKGIAKGSPNGAALQDSDRERARRWAARINVAADRSHKTPTVVAGGSVTALAFVRSLGSRGIPVFCLDHRSWEVGMLSRYASPTTLPDPAKNPAAWTRFLLDAGDEMRVRPALIVTGDPLLRSLAATADALAQTYDFVLPPRTLVDSLIDKRSQYDLLAEAGAPLPRALAPASEDEAADAAATVGLPCVVKPALSHIWASGNSAKAVRAASVEAVRSAYTAMEAAGVGAIVQEFIPGGDDSFWGCICHFDRKGRLRACFTKRKLRQYPVGFGNGSYQVSVDCAETAELSVRLLERIGYRGTAAVEFKRDSRDGSLKLIEINCRAVSGTQLSIESGVDFPWIVYRDSIGQPLAPVTEFATGRKLVNISWDVRAYLHGGDRSLRGLGRWIKSVFEADADAVWSLRDPGPGIRTWARFWRS